MRPFFVGPALLLIVGLCLPAQPRPGAPSAVIDGVVTDSSLKPLADATAWILGSDIRVNTAASGRFRILALPAGQYILLVRRLGYAPASAALRVSAGDTLRPAFSLAPIAITLDSVIVGSSRSSFRMAEFEERRRRGEGKFMTQAEIDQRNVAGVSDLLRTFTSVAITGTGGMAVNRRTLPSKTCPFQFVLDGILIPPPKSVDQELPSPKEIAGIEVYANSATIPLQYKTFGGNNTFNYGGGFCGVILLWTRGG